MALSVEELQMEFQKLKEEEQEGKGSSGSIFLEMAIFTYQEIQQREGWDDEEEAIFNGQTILVEEEKRKGGNKMENLELKKATKKGKNKMKNRYNVRKQQKREIQQRGKLKRVEFERWGGKKARIDKKGRGKGKRSHKGLKQDVKKQGFFQRQRVKYNLKMILQKYIRLYCRY